ncbi:hypothetical protein JR316_0011151 [Psilocybe cubensis]|uniref:Uncharacterized protein n=2 Tax=Psilocybe cubensis TaxID=181762 RepID=A0A8H8CFP9_PSICU|nr:hypothetical protein JR316_0011151 [Psilocybe cubensis]KAH9477232.1 hypothetical protein JR316_0011151 [Psilocybe cubensis]
MSLNIGIPAPSPTEILFGKGLLDAFLRTITKTIEAAPVPLATAPKWKATAAILKSAIRDDISKLILIRPHMKVRGHQIDHVFELQYFVSAFLFTVGLYIMTTGDVTFKPDVTDISLAVTIINSESNVCALVNRKHKFKREFFRASETKEFYGDEDTITANLDTLLEYMCTYSSRFSAYLTELSKTILAKPDIHTPFKTMFIANLLLTPWCQGMMWKPIFDNARLHQVPFSKTVTMKNYMSQPWMNDNLVYEKISVAIGGEPTEDEYIKKGAMVYTYDKEQQEIGIIETEPFTEEELRKRGLWDDDSWLEEPLPI